ncbi:pyridoxamine 5'-phosphate oxidase family protein [Alkalicoccus luteus]|uniref:Pyridoxamine 5'-phosphate oxidase N-terminal domain-containing protein n=1 Tax=Alkalicoccus luteus TaxID=1237094 RepID=A0A969PQC4_9BACI|nr:pyridoxamine 5'-phosphate oxidase family protein [Alkalicoccus luteus]NJP36481.1 hypothetical protein [Alkalicoccus luteus]
MGNRIEQELTEDLLRELQEEHYVMLATIDQDTKGPSVNAISWIYAADRNTIRFAVDRKSRIISNIHENPAAVMTVIADGSTYALSGKSKIVQEKIDNVPVKLSMMELHIQEVKDVMFYGARLTHEPQFEKTYDEDAAAKLDRQVMDALQSV